MHNPQIGYDKAILNHISPKWTSPAWLTLVQINVNKV